MLTAHHDDCLWYCSIVQNAEHKSIRRMICNPCGEFSAPGIVFLFLMCDSYQPAKGSVQYVVQGPGQDSDF